MNENILATRYAKGLTTVLPSGQEKTSLSSLSEIAEVLSIEISLAEVNASVQDIFKNPRISSTVKENIINDILKTINCSEPIQQFIKLLFTKNRLPLLQTILKNTERLLDERHNRVRGTLSSAAPVSDDTHQVLQAVFTQKIGKSVLLTTKLTPEILGGLIVRIKDTVYDGSIKTRLSNLHTSLINK